MAWENGNKPHTSLKERERILERDNYRCQIQGPTCLSVATEVDHIDNTRNANYWRDRNKRSVCAPCHKAETQREAAEARKRREARGLFPAERHPGLA